jgi:adenylate cyclase
MKIIDFIFGKLRNKVLLAITFLLCLGIGSVVYISTTLGLRDSTQTAYAAAAELTKSLVTQFEQEVRGALDRSRSWAVLAKDSENLSQLLQDDISIVGVQLYDVQENKLEKSGFSNLGPHVKMKTSDIQIQTASIEKIKGFNFDDSSNVPALFEKSTIDSTPFFRITTALSLNTTDPTHRVQKVLITWLNPSAFKEAFSQAGTFEKFLFLENGEMLTRSIVSGHDKTRIPELVKWDQRLLKQLPLASTKLTNSRLTYNLEHNKLTEGGFIGHSYRSRLPGVYVAVLSSEASLLETIFSVARRSAYLGLAILCLSLAIGVVFSDSVVKPLLNLVEVSRMISEGSFNIQLKPQGRDEIATLTNAFNQMALGLAERERIKEVFGKFHSKAVFQKLLQEEKLRLGGERIPVTVFFSDIRSFTSSSEAMSPEEVVEFLNEYMSEMVAVIEQYGGVVDKYVGDAIMAIWGMPEPNPEKDAEFALLACLEMRQKLNDLNERRKSRGQSPIQIGMGLNSGVVVAGNIGSPSRMEYTVIGDTVNTASRMESLTKDFQTDLLLNESTVGLISNIERFQLVGPYETKVKGKQDKALVYGCQGFSKVELPPAPSQAA